MLSPRPRKLKRVIIREEYVALTGDYKKAVILHELEYRQSRTYELDGYLEEEGSRMRQQGIESNVLPTKGWFRRPADQLSKDTLLNLSPSNILSHIQFLVNHGWIQERKNPNELRDRTKQYRINLVQLKADLEQIGYQLEGWALDSLLVEDFERPFSVLENAFSKTENANHEIENAFSKTKNPFSKTEEHYINTNTHIHEHTHTNGVSVGKGKTAKSEFKREQIEEYFTEIARTDKNIQSVSALARSRWMDGTEDEKIRIYYEAKHQQTQEPRRKFTTEPCPKCSGTKVEIVPKKGARPCDSCLDDLGKPTGFKPLE